MLGIRQDCIFNIAIYSMTNTEPLLYYVRKCLLGFLEHILCLPEEEPARRYAFYVPPHGKGSLIVHAPLTSRTSNGWIGYHEVDISAATLAEDQCAWKYLVIACSAAEGWWWWWCCFWMVWIVTFLAAIIYFYIVSCFCFSTPKIMDQS